MFVYVCASCPRSRVGWGGGPARYPDDVTSQATAAVTSGGSRCLGSLTPPHPAQRSFLLVSMEIPTGLPF